MQKHRNLFAARGPALSGFGVWLAVSFVACGEQGTAPIGSPPDIDPNAPQEPLAGGATTGPDAPAVGSDNAAGTGQAGVGGGPHATVSNAGTAGTTGAGAASAAGATGAAGAAGGPAVGWTAGCPAGKYAVCTDFESAELDPNWTMKGTDMKVETAMKAAANYALHFSNLQPRVGQMISTVDVGALPSVMWGRFYLRVTPGAPEGHGGFLYAYDQDGARWEIGFEHNAFMADYHGIGTPEKPYYTSPKIQDRWLCVEFNFDGAAPADPRIWVDGTLLSYYRKSGAPGPFKVTKWKRFDIGFRPSHGTSLSTYEGTSPPVVTDMWMDDIALDSQRIGCE